MAVNILKSNIETNRIKIFCSVSEITPQNIVEVVSEAKSLHEMNANRIQYLLDYEAGNQPLQREKRIYPEIDIKTVDNLANYCKEFRIGYFWSTPMSYVQRGRGKDIESDIDENAISELNEMVLNEMNIGFLDQAMAEFIEVGGIGHRMIDIKTDFDDGQGYVNAYTLDSRYAFCVYYNDIAQTKALGVTYRKIEDKTYYTCFDKNYRYDIVDGKLVLQQINPLGMIPIIEYERAPDRSGFFERVIPMMDNLNILVSDFANDSAQKVQEIWWGNDIEFPLDENGKAKTPESGQWMVTYTGDNKNPKIQPLSSNFDGSSVLTSIQSTRNEILKRCNVPMQYESQGGGSTGVAMDAASGWSSAEIAAIKEQQMIEKGKREELRLILKALEFVPLNILSADHPLRTIKSKDVDFHFNRRKNYDMSVKANTFATLIKHGIDGRHALRFIDGFADTEEVWQDSKQLIEQCQQSTFGEESTDDSDRIMNDNSDQIGNSPFIDGMSTKDNQLN